MVNNFNFSRTPNILFGVGSTVKLAETLQQYDSPVLLITGTSSFQKSIYRNRILDLLSKNDIRFFTATVSGEPSPRLVDSIVNNYGNSGIKAVVAIGGGSALDTGKAVSAMLPAQKPVSDFLEGIGTATYNGIKIPFVAVPTTSGTGSETTNNAVLSNIGANGFKKSLRHKNLVPDTAIVDPGLTVSCPSDVTASCGMDAFTQLIESYISTKANPFTDAMAIDGIVAACRSLSQVFFSPENIDARSNMSYAAMISGITLANAGLGVVHGFASPVGAHFNIPHGVVCGTLLPPSMEYTIDKLRKTDKENVALVKCAAIGKLLANDGNKSIDFYRDTFVEKLYELTDELNIKRLGEFGIIKEDLKKIAEETSCKNNPVLFETSELIEIQESRL